MFSSFSRFWSFCFFHDPKRFFSGVSISLSKNTKNKSFVPVSNFFLVLFCA
jgi:hypothetical protein